MASAAAACAARLVLVRGQPAPIVAAARRCAAYGANGAPRRSLPMLYAAGDCVSCSHSRSAPSGHGCARLAASPPPPLYNGGALAGSRSLGTSARCLVEDGDRKRVEPKPVFEEEDVPQTLVARFKYLWRKYWYVVIPVHVATSCCWFAAFYSLAATGVDIIAVLDYVSALPFAPAAWVALLKKASKGGYFAIAYVLYKVATPARYAVTVGGTHVAIRLLSRRGWLPTAQQVRTDVKGYLEARSVELRARRQRVGAIVRQRRDALRDRKAEGGGGKTSH